MPELVCAIDDRDRGANDNAPAQPDATQPQAGLPPASLLAAMARGARGRCPACGSTPFFPRFLKPTLSCAACRQDWSHQRADDFPAYVAILLTGHIIVSLAITLEHIIDPPVWVHLTLWLPLATLLLVGLLQPIKGAIIAIQWWYGMHGFEAARRAASSTRTGYDSRDRENKP